MRPKTLQDIAAIDREFLIPADIAPILHCAPYFISVVVREDKKRGTNSFPFPTIRMGSRTKIPKRPFLEAMGYRFKEEEDHD